MATHSEQQRSPTAGPIEGGDGLNGDRPLILSDAEIGPRDVDAVLTKLPGYSALLTYKNSFFGKPATVAMSLGLTIAATTVGAALLDYNVKNTAIAASLGSAVAMGGILLLAWLMNLYQNTKKPDSQRQQLMWKDIGAGVMVNGCVSAPLGAYLLGDVMGNPSLTMYHAFLANLAGAGTIAGTAVGVALALVIVAVCLGIAAMCCGLPKGNKPSATNDGQYKAL